MVALTWLGWASIAGLVSVWVAYPLAVRVAALGRRPAAPDAPPSGQPRVTVVIATRDDAESVVARVANALETDYPRHLLDAVVAVDGGGRAPVADALSAAGVPATVVDGDAPGGKACALNAAMRAATGDVVVFADTRQRFDAATIPRLVAALGDARFGAASGRLELRRAGAFPSPVELYWRLERWLRRHEARRHSSVGVTGAVYASRRELWRPLPPGLLLDDVYAPMSLVLRGYRVGFVDDARAWETRVVERDTEFRRKVRTLTGVIQLCAWLPDVLVPWRNPVWLQFLFHKLLRFLTPYWLVGATLFVAARLADAAARHPRAALIALGSAAVAAAATAAVGRVNPLRLARAGLAWVLVIHAAVVVATVNGLRRSWNVWAR